MSAPMKAEKSQPIQVFVRTRPFTKLEKLGRSTNCIEISGTKDITVKQQHSKKYSFDKVFGPNVKQVDVYSTVVAPLLSEVLSGYNCTVFAYGQTGAGKTYTMVGGPTNESNTWQEDETAGIIPRALAHLFEELRVLQQEHTVRVSYLELYNEELYDLLAETDDISRIRIFEDQQQKGSVIIQGIEEQTVLNKNEVYKILEKGQEKRRTAATLMNAQSSRSHTVFTITVHTRETTVEGELLVKTGKLYLVDLAGSENIGKSGAVDKRAREAGSINQSLLTLGRVIKALVEKGQHIPYRESKLTRILQDSLGGRTKTSIIANISLASSSLEETLSTLEYAYRARNITNRPEVNLRTSQKSLMLEYVNEINRLRKDLGAARSGTGVYLAQENYDKLITDNVIKTEELSESIVRIREMQEKLSSLEEQKAFIEANWQALQLSFEESQNHIRNVSAQLEKTEIEKEQEKHLAQSYEKKALKLHDSASQLLTVTKSSLKNEEHLHKKIESIRNIANSNFKSVQSVIQNVVDMEQQISNTITKQTEYSTEINQNLLQLLRKSQKSCSENKSLQTEFRDKLLQDLVTTNSIFQSSADAQKINLQKWISSVFEECKATHQQQNSICSESLDGLNNNLLESIRASKEHYETHSTRITEQISGINRSLEDFSKSFEAGMNKIVNTVSSEFNILSNALKEREKRLHSNLSRHPNKQKILDEFTSFLLKTQDMCQALQKESSLDVTDINEEIVLNQQYESKLNKAKSKIETEFPPIIRGVNKQINENIKLQQNILDEIDKETKEATSDMAKENFVNQIHSNTRSLLDLSSVLVSNTSNINSDFTEKDKENHQHSQTQLESHIQILSERIQAQDVMAEATQDKWIYTLDIMEKEVTNLEGSYNATKENITSISKQSQSELLSLLNNESLKLTRSGDTPVRANLPTTLNLSTPVPRHRMLKQLQDGTEISNQHSLIPLKNSNHTHQQVPLTLSKNQITSDDTIQDYKENTTFINK